MQTVTKPFIFTILLIAACLQTAPAGAEPQPMGCHCFKQREYNPNARFLADPYVLTTSFNSMMSRAYGLSKGQIIMMRMRQGVSGDDMIISLHLARVVGRDFQQLIFGRNQGQKWSQLITSREPAADPVLSAIRENKPDHDIAAAATDQLISSYFHLEIAEITKLRARGLKDKEITLAAGLARKQNKSLGDIISLVTDEGQSWSEIAAGFGYIGKEVGAMIESLKKD